MKFALKAGLLSFDATRISANDVDFPIDVVHYEKDSFNITETRYKKDELSDISKMWDSKISEAINDLPDDWIEKIYISNNMEEEDMFDEGKWSGS